MKLWTPTTARAVLGMIVGGLALEAIKRKVWRDG